MVLLLHASANSSNRRHMETNFATTTFTTPVHTELRIFWEQRSGQSHLPCYLWGFPPMQKIKSGNPLFYTFTQKTIWNMTISCCMNKSFWILNQRLKSFIFHTSKRKREKQYWQRIQIEVVKTETIYFLLIRCPSMCVTASDFVKPSVPNFECRYLA